MKSGRSKIGTPNQATTRRFAYPRKQLCVETPSYFLDFCQSNHSQIPQRIDRKSGVALLDQEFDSCLGPTSSDLTADLTICVVKR